MNKKLILSLALSGLVLTATAQTTVAPAIPRDEKIEQQIETLLKKMTLDEKVGQMCELTIDLLQKRANPFAGLDPKNITVKDLQKIIKRYKLEKEFKLGKEMPSSAFPGSTQSLVSREFVLLSSVTLNWNKQGLPVGLVRTMGISLSDWLRVMSL